MVEITVYNMGQGREFAEHSLPSKIIVNAHCVGGESGIMAFFTHPKNCNLMCIADGDDGNWWYVSTVSKDWVEQIICALADLKGLSIDYW